jgi:hypothetical protein
LDPTLLILGVTSLAPIGAIYAAFARVGRVERERRDAWSRVARELGLAYEHDAIVGRIEEQPVQVTLQRRRDEAGSVHTVVGASFLPALDLGLSLERSTTWDELARAFGGADAAVGDATFDGAFEIAADEPSRVAALLGPELRAPLLSAHAAGVALMLTDAGLFLFAPGAVRDTRWLGWALRFSASVGRLVASARARVPPATPLAHHRAAWRRYAAAAGLAPLDTPLSAGGTIAGQRVHVYAARTGPLAYRLEVEVRFEEPLGLGLLVRPKNRIEHVTLLFGGEVHRLGDDDFDDAFVVRCRAPEELPAVLDADVRAELVALAARNGGLVLRDEGLAVRAGAIGRPEHAPRLVEELRGVAEQVFHRARRSHAGHAGPYR